ncbi:MAG: cytochrome C oxidase subunit IV family protein [Acidobacteriota bacterium]
MAHSTSHASEAHSDDHEHHSIKPHVITLGLLFVLTLVTYLVSLVHLGPLLADLVALAIAVVKAVLVVMVFMHVRESTSLIKITAGAGFFWVFLFFAYLAADVLTRDGITVVEGWSSWLG